MILIAHRGNINGPNRDLENSPDYIREASKLGYHVEIDVWCFSDNEIFLGHDNPQYQVDLKFLMEDGKYIFHAKTIRTFQFLLDHDLNCFFHDNDKCTLTSRNKVWLYPSFDYCKLGIIVMPEWLHTHSREKIIKNIEPDHDFWITYISSIRDKIYGVCSDYVNLLK